VGPERAAQLERLGIRTLCDLLLHRPLRYEDRRGLIRIAEISGTVQAAVHGRVVGLGVKYFRHRTRSLFELILDDGTARLHCRWWNMPFMESHFEPGQEVMAYGRVVNLKPRTIDHPDTEIVETAEERSIHLGRVVPIYPLTEGLSQRWLRTRIWTVVEQLAGSVEEPDPRLRGTNLMPKAEALRALHFPNDVAQAEAARRRLAFDEFVGLQWEIQSRRQRFFASARGLPCQGTNQRIRPFLRQLGFPLTEGQTAVLREIRQDMGTGRPMRRLVQGEVGSGKTVVAAAAALMALESAYSVALMAPTEILARQHWQRFTEWFGPLGVPVALRTGDLKIVPEPGASRGKGTPPRLIIGTHALLTADFGREKLGLVIIDEQHKFGVAQREQLLRKGHCPHLLVMTATPIPRTLALTLYGDLDVSTIAGSPPGRGRMRTFLRTRNALPKVWQFAREQLALGRQAYVVFPRVEEDVPGELKALMRECAAVRELLSPYSVDVVHGRLAAAEKERVMHEFRTGAIQVLLGTAVIEVGLDVSNATLMIIENAERFGLAQLHQLRGRVGRGVADSHCILIPGKDSPEARSRLRVLTETTDGFAIAEADLRLRGPGELVGLAQSGAPPLRFADLAGDRDLLDEARAAVADFLKNAPRAGRGEPRMTRKIE
jgi:ATP-dependent DNA helicase RecG